MTKLSYIGKSGKAGEWIGVSSALNNCTTIIEGITFSLSTSPLGQIGVFPEQRLNWRWIRSKLTARSQRYKQYGQSGNLKVLNGFAYTGGSTVAAAMNSGSTEVRNGDRDRDSIHLLPSSHLHCDG